MSKAAKAREINLSADVHYLAEYEQNMFKFHVEIVQNKVAEIIKEYNLKGNWTLSQDFKWLIKLGD